MKNDLKYIPTIGWTWWFLEFSFLRRNWQKDENTIKNSLKALNEYPIPYLVSPSFMDTILTSVLQMETFGPAAVVYGLAV